MKVKETTSPHITFTLRKGQCPPVSINQTVIPHVEKVKYLGLHFDRRLTCKEHIAMKRKKIRSQNTRNKMAHRKKLPPITRKQTTHLQNDTQTCMDLWN